MLTRRDALKGFALTAAGLMVPTHVLANPILDLMVGARKRSASGGGSSCITDYYSFTTISGNDTSEVGNTTSRMYIGVCWESAVFNSTICAVEFYIAGKHGSTRNYQVEIWALSAEDGSLSSLLGTSNVVSSSSMTAATWQSFTFASPVVRNSYLTAVVITPTTKSADATNFIDASVNINESAGDPYYVYWASDYSIAYSRTQSRVLVKVKV